VTDDQPAAITDADVRALAAKLKGLHTLLTPPEQALLRAVLRRAADRDDVVPDTAGFAWAVGFNPFPYLDVVAGTPPSG
jgi:hypothetical protein